MTRLMVFDRFSEYLRDLHPADVFSAVRTATLGGSDTLEISTSARLNKGERVMYKDHRGHWHEYIVAGGDAAHDSGLSAVGSYHLECSWCELRTARLIVDKRPGIGSSSGILAAEALGTALEGTRWAVGTVTQASRAASSWYHVSPFEALKDVAETWGGELRCDISVTVRPFAVERSVSLLAHRGDLVPVRYDHGRDVKEVEASYDEGDVHTALYCYGKGLETGRGGYGRKIGIETVNGGVPYVADDAAKQLWGQMGPDGLEHAFGVFEDPQCDDPAKLKAEGQAALREACRPKASYRATVAAFAAAGTDLRARDLGDAVDIVDRSFYAARGESADLRLSGRVTKLVEDLLDPTSSKVTVGDVRKGADSLIAGLSHGQQSLQSGAAVWDDVAGGTSHYIQSLVDSLNKEINATGGYTYIKPGQGIWVYDRAEDEAPTKVINLMGGALRIADTKDSGGNWEWRSVFVSGHLAADLVTAAKLTAGFIGSADSGNFWNLDTGEFRLSPDSVASNGLVTEGEAVASVETQYAVGDSRSIPPVDGWAAETPQWTIGLNVWQRTVLTLADGTERTSQPVCIQGAEGQDGLPGTPGTDGKSSYVHIKYSAVAEPTDSDLTEIPSEYIGICVSEQQSDPTEASAYEWSKWEGHDGAQGIQGPPGTNGTSTYVHFAYARTSDGVGGFSLSPFEGAKYVGVRTDDVQADSTRPADYKWSLIKGADGTGVSELVGEFYLSTSQVEPVGGEWGTEQPAWQEGRYLWTRTKITWTSGESTYTDAVIDKALNGIAESVGALDAELDQQGIFDRLTNGGVSQGIYLDNGKVYINGEFIQSGSIKVIDVTANSNTAKCKVNIDTTKGLQIFDLNGNLLAGTKLDGSKTRFYTQAVGVDDNYLACDWKDSGGTTYGGLSMVRGGAYRFGIVPIASANGVYGVALTVDGKYVMTLASRSSSSQGYEAGVCIHSPCTTFVPVISGTGQMSIKGVKGIAITSRGIYYNS